MPRYVATVSGAGVHAIKDMEQGDTVCLFMLKRGGSFEQLRDNLNTCLRALNYVDERSRQGMDRRRIPHADGYEMSESGDVRRADGLLVPYYRLLWGGVTRSCRRKRSIA